MITATVYRDLSDSYERICVDTQKSIKEAFKHCNIDFEHAVILVNGKRESADYVLKDSDIVFIRRLPQWWVLDKITDAVSNWGWANLYTLFFWVGNKVYSALKNYWALQKKLANLSSSSTSVSVTEYPYIAGASNTTATGKTQPYIIGTHLFTPYILNGGGASGSATGYHTISGTNGTEVFYNVVLEGGFNKQVIRKIKADNVIIKKFSDTEPQEFPNADNETSFAFNSTSVFADASSFGEIAQDGADFENDCFNVKIVEEESASELKKADDDDYEDLIFTLADYSMGADISILLNGLCYYNTSGTRCTRTLTIIPSYSLDYNDPDRDEDTEATWVDFPKGFAHTVKLNTPIGTLTRTIYSNTFSASTLNQMRFSAHVDFDFNDLSYTDSDGVIQFSTVPIAIKLRCETDSMSASDGTAYDTVYSQYVHSYPFNVKKSREAGAFVAERVIAEREAQYSTRIGLHILSTDSNADSLGKISIITSGIAPIWDSDAQEWKTDGDGNLVKEITSNPASWLLEVLTSDTHPASKVALDEIDLDAFGALYELCEAQEWACDMVLTDGDTKQNVLETICTTCHATMYRNINGLISIVADWTTDNVCGIINEQNCTSFSYERDNSRIADGVKATYIDGDTYEETSYIVMRDGSDSEDRDTESVIKEVNLTGITNYEHVVKMCRYVMAVEKLRPRTITAEVGKEGIFYAPLSILQIQHPALKIGLGSAEVKALITDLSGNITGLELYDPIELTTTENYCIEMQCVNASGKPCTLVKSIDGVDGETTTVSFSAVIAYDAEIQPQAGAVIAYGYTENGATSSMLVTGVTPTSTGYKLTLVDYNENIYDTGTIDDYDPHITQKVNASTVSKITTTASIAQVAEAQAVAIKAAQQAADLVTKGVTFSNVRYVNGTSMSIEELVQYIDQAVQDASAGIQITDEKLSIKIEDVDAGATSLIEQTASNILATVRQTYATTDDLDTTEATLSSAISVTASAVDEVVAVDNAIAGRMSLSLELPAIIDSAIYTQFVTLCGSTETAAVYTQNTTLSTDTKTYYTIKSDVDSDDLTALWTLAIKKGLIASQIDLSATTIKLAAENIVITDTSGQEVALIDTSTKMITAALIDVQELLAQDITLNATGYIKSANYTEDANGYPTAGFKLDSKTGLISAYGTKTVNGDFSGEVWSESARFSNDCFLPMIEFAQTYNDYTQVSIDLTSYTAAELIAKFDNLIDNNTDAVIRTHYTETTDKRLYIGIVSDDDSKPYVTNSSLFAWYLWRYTNSSGKVVYAIGSTSGNKRILILNGVKYTSSDYSNKLLFTYFSKELTVNAKNAFFGGTLESKYGLLFSEPSWYSGQSGGRSYTEANYFNFLAMAGVDSTPRLCAVSLSDGFTYLGVVKLANSTTYVITGAFTYNNYTSAARTATATTYASGTIYLNQGVTTSVNITSILF